MPIIPFLTILSALILLYCKQYRLGSVFFAIFYSLTAGIINSGKKVESDLADYLRWFQASADLSFFDYIFFKGNDFLFFIYNFIFYNYISKSDEFYIFFTISICYFFIFWAGFKYFKRRKSEKNNLIVLCIFLMFPLIFVSSGHFLRQFIAATIVTYSVYGIYRKQYRILGFIAASLVHSSAFLFIIFMIIPFHRLALKQILLIIPTTLITLQILKSLPYISTGIKNIDIIYYRLVFQSGADLVMSSLAIILVFFVLILAMKNNKDIHSQNGLESYEYRGDVYIGLTALLVIIFYMIPSMAEYSLRYSFYIWVFFPIFIADKIKFKNHNGLFLIIMFLVYILSLKYVESNQWDFTCGFLRLFTFEIGFSSCIS